MSFPEELCNRALYRELKNEEGQNIVLFTIDGFAFFGLLNRVDDRVVTLTPGTGESEVVVLTPGNRIYREDYAHIDICTVAAKARSIINCPFSDQTPPSPPSTP